MAERIDTAAVLGAGVMGSAIAAHLAGCGIRTHLLDIVPPKLEGDAKKDPAARSSFASGGLKNALKAKPAAFFDADAAALVTPGNLDDHLERLAECDLIIEAVVENLDIKKSLFEKIAPHIKDDAIVASNTSGLDLDAMSAVLPKGMQERFLVMHFFNPVRYMHLLELVPGPKTADAVMKRAAAIGDLLGKGLVYGKNTTNFVANRIGVYGMMLTIQLMQEEGLTIEVVDKIAGKAMGRPKSAAFQTGDIVGIDTFAHVAKNCYDALPDDEERDVFKMPQWVLKMIENKQLGRKSKAGFYKKGKGGIQVWDVAKGEYRDQEKVRFDSLGAAKKEEDVRKRLKGMVAADDEAGRFAWKTLSRTLAYTARRMGEIADDVVNVDNALRWGFNWDLGPFEAWDAIGVKESVERMQGDGIDVPAWVTDMLAAGQESFYGGTPAEPTYYDVASKKSVAKPRDERELKLAAFKHDKGNIVKENLSAALVDIGDGVLCLEVHSKMNTIDDDVIAMMFAGVEEAEKNFRALVIANDGEHFGAGANLLPVFMAAQKKEWDTIDKVVGDFQQAIQRLRYSHVPVVSAPFQFTFGGGAEIAMAADAIQAHVETYIGLVEVGVGLVPAGGGCLRLVERYSEEASKVKGADLLPFVGQASIQIAMATVATGAGDAKRLRFLLANDGITLNRDHLLYEAKQRAMGMAAAGYRKPVPRVLRAGGYDMKKTIGAQVWGLVESKWASPHDALIANKVAHIMCGGDVAKGAKVVEQHYLDLEREAFLSLCGEEKSQARMQSILMTNKPLRN